MALDYLNNVVAGYTGTLHITSTDVQAIVPYDMAFNASNAGAMTLPVTLATVGNQSITGSDYDAPAITGLQNVIVINPNIATRIALTGYSASVVAGTQGNVTVSMLDAYSNVATGFTGTVNFTSDDPLAVFPANTAFVGGNLGVRAITLTFNTHGNHVLNANGATNPNVAGQLPVVVVSPNSVTHFIAQNYPTPVFAGQQANITIFAVDNFNNVVPNYTGTVQIRSTDPNAGLPANYSFVLANNGNASLPVTLKTTGTFAISANDTSTPSISGFQGGIVVSPNVATRFVLTGIPNPSIAGSGNTLTVTAFDNYNNVATTFADLVAITCSDANASLSTSAYFTSGVGTFPVTFYTAGTQWLNANDTGNPNLAMRQDAILVNPAPAAALLATAFPTTMTACQGANITITAVDNYNNVVPTYTGTVTLTSSDTAAALPAPAAFVAGNAGVRPLTVTLKTPGAQTITATDGGGLTVTDTNINVMAGSPNVVTILAPTMVQPTATFGATVSIYDNCNNLSTGYTGTINLTSTDASGTPSSTPVALVFGAGDAGVKTVSGLKFKTPSGARALNANDSATPTTINGHATIAVTAMAFYADWDDTSATQSSYTYNTSKIDFTASYAELTSTNTQALDNTSANFTGGTAVNTRWDTGVAAMVQGNSNPNQPVLVFLGAEPFDANILSSTVYSKTGTYSSTLLTVTNTPYADFTPFSGAGSYALQGNETAAGGGTLYMKLYDMTNQSFVLDVNSQLNYWMFPQGPDASNITAGNSNFAVVYVRFTDGTITSSGTITATVGSNTGVALTPGAVSSKITVNQWNRITATLGVQSLNGKTVDHIGIYWTRGSSAGSFLTYFDDIMITGMSNNAQTNTSTIASDWTPQYSSIVAYYPFDGNGPIADTSTITSAIGSNITGHNSDGRGLKYVAARFNTGVYFDGVDDYSVIGAASGFPASASISVAGWVKPSALTNTANPCPRVWIFGASTSSFISLLPQCQGTYASSAQGVLNMRISGTDYFTGVVQSPNDTWQHWVSTYDGTTAITYLNGQKASSATWSAALSGALGGYNYFGADYFSNYFRGIVDEWAVWTTVLSPNDVKLIYDRQGAVYSGKLTSRVLTSPYQATGTTSVAWNTTYPAWKPLPSDAVSERTSGYASNGNTLSVGLEYLWHLDETALGTVYGGDFLDDTGHGNTGTATPGNGGALVVGQSTLFNRGIATNGNCVSTAIKIPNPTTFTISIWFNTVAARGGYLIGFGDLQAQSSANYDRQIYIGPDGYVIYGVNPGSPQTVYSTRPLHDGRWHHAVATVSASNVHSFYIDGVLQGTVTGAAQPYNGYWHIAAGILQGWPDVYSWEFYGTLDEAAVWKRALTASEVSQLYRRGATRFKYRLRTCVNSACSDNQAWRGPDGTSSTYFSELLNTSETATQNASSPNLALANYANLGINSNQTYLQYQSIWESDDVFNQCTYNSVNAPCSVENTNMIFNRVTYDTTSPTITNANTVAYYSLTSFAAALGSAGCAGGVTYTLSPDNVTYYYYTGAAWATSNGTLAQSSTAAQLSAANLATYSTNYGAGKTYFRAFLTSNGVNPCTLQSVGIGGTQ